MKKFIIPSILVILSFNSALSQHYIIFHAYPASDHSLAGHAFVSFITKDKLKQQTIVDAKWGFRPAQNTSKTNAFFLAVSDNMKENWTTTGEFDFVAEIKSKDVYKRCLQVKDIWDAKNYSLLASQTCVDFVRDIAYRIPGVVIPPSLGNIEKWQWPKDFLLTLKKLNPKIDAESRKSLSEVTTSPPTTQLVPYRQGRKWGYCDLNKKIIIACKYDQVALFHEGLAAVTVNNKMGYIDETGKLIIPYKYGIAGDFNSNGTAMVWNGRSEYDEPSARIDKKGQSVQGKYFQWTNSNVSEPLFVDGMAIVSKEVKGGDKYGFINESGSLVIPIIFSKAKNFSENFARVYDEDKGWVFIDKSGKYQTPFEYIYYNDFSQGLAIINENISGTQDVLRAGYIDNSFKKNFITGRGIRLHVYGDGLFLAEKNGMMGYVDKVGKVIIPFTYVPQDVGGDTYYGSAFINGVAIVSKNNKLGFINKRGQSVTPFIYEQIDYIKELDLFRCQWATPRSNYLEIGYMSAQGVKYWQE
ncbi:WG repeat-containing protein [Runella sp.]|uniref:WG repeat-containing protein n=1 Tax=Runella sp. TaxID=1960881 RepID=UPI00301ACEA3